MGTTQGKVRATKRGRVNINEVRGGLYFNFPTAWFGGKQERKSAQLPATPEGWKKAEAIANQMELDWLSGNFDPSLEKYRLKSPANLVALPTKTKAEPTLLEVWEAYLEHKKPMIAETTFLKHFERLYTNTIKKAIESGCTSAVEVRAFIAKNRASESATKLLNALSEAYTLAQKEKKVSENPYLGMAKELRESKAAKAKKSSELGENTDWEESTGEDVRAFEPSEVQAIIEYFENSKTVSHWANYAKFLFLTGCRPGEAAALRWGHIKGDCERIVFDQSFDVATKITKQTKTYTSRMFPCSPELRELLKSIKPESVDNHELVFKTREGKQVNMVTFHSVWSGSGKRVGVIPELIKQGKVRQYLRPYSARHFFITQQVRAGIRPDVIASWCGNSVDVIFKHYYQPDKDAVPANVLQLSAPIVQ